VRPLWDERYQPADHEIIRRKAAKFARTSRRRVDAEDIAQDLALHVLKWTDRHTPRPGTRAALMETMARNKLLNLIHARDAKKRDDRRNIDYDNAPERMLVARALTISQTCVTLDMRDLAAALPPDLRQVYDLLLQQFSDVEIQKHLGLSRQRVRTLVLKVEDHIRKKLHFDAERATNPPTVSVDD